MWNLWVHSWMYTCVYKCAKLSFSWTLNLKVSNLGFSPSKSLKLTLSKSRDFSLNSMSWKWRRKPLNFRLVETPEIWGFFLNHKNLQKKMLWAVVAALQLSDAVKDQAFSTYWERAIREGPASRMGRKKSRERLATLLPPIGALVVWYGWREGQAGNACISGSYRQGPSNWPKMSLRR